MPGGIGSIDHNLAQRLRCDDRNLQLTVNASPKEIYYNLGIDRVHYVPQEQFLYFPQSSYFPILETLRAVHSSLDVPLNITQLFMDNHGYYKGAQRIEMSTELARAVLVALRLKGIRISIASDRGEQTP